MLIYSEWIHDGFAHIFNLQIVVFCCRAFIYAGGVLVTAKMIDVDEFEMVKEASKFLD